ncbi:MAG: DUF5329 domain-containing protein [Thiohalocapsa sp.]
MSKTAAVLCLILWAITLAAYADTASEIDHLLDFIQASDCVFIRNGDEHDAAAARDHIQRKYAYAKRWIETSEQFIEYTATKSSTTGKTYSVICAGRKEPSADWLNRELSRFRASP